MGYRIGSFNIRDLNYSNQTQDGENINRDFGKIAEIIINEEFDVVAIQEVNSNSAISHLVDVINRRKKYGQIWEFDYSGKAATTVNDPEGYAFVWNASRIRLLKLPQKNNPAYYNCAGGKGILRPPYYARFTSRGLRGGTNFELRIVNVHIKDSKNERERIQEFDILVKNVLPRICDHNELSENGEYMPAYTFLAGDYNLRLDKSERADIRIEGITFTNYTGKNRYFKTVQEQKTSLRIPKEQQVIDECYASNYDHFTYELNLIEKLRLRDDRIEALGKYFSECSEPIEQLKDYRLKVSDHVPIVMNIDIK